MRTIKFRGKDVESGKWVYGSLNTSGDEEDYMTIEWVEVNTYRGCFYTFSFIDDKTVGQFSGLYDNKGKEIYEGDVLSAGGEYNVVCEFKHGAFGYSRFGRFNVFAISAKFLVKKEFEVIGNIYDNPELLKGSNE